MSVAAKRIYQLAKEFERDEKEIIAFLTNQGIKVANRLSAVSEDTYNMLKAKYTAPPEPEPVPEPEPPKPEPAPAKVEPPKPETSAQSETPAASAEDAAPAKKKKKKKKKSAQLLEEPQYEFELPSDETDSPVSVEELNSATQVISRNGVLSGNVFIQDYRMGLGKKKYKANSPKLSHFTDTWALLQNIPIDNPDSSPVNYWQAVNKLTTRAFKLINQYGMGRRELLAEMRNLMKPLGFGYEPLETLTDEENQLFDEQRQMIFRRFGHGIGKVNDNLFALKNHAENMKARYEFMDFVEYLTNPDAELRSKERVPFMEIADDVAFCIGGIVRRVDFYVQNKERIINVVKNFFEWRDGYVKLKQQGAPADKLEKYLTLEKKFVDLVEYMSFDNLLFCMNKKVVPFDNALELLNDYRDNMDDPDAKRNFQYKIRGVTLVIFKPKEFIFLYQLAELESGKDYRPPEEIAAAEAAKAAAETETSSDAASAAAKENPADTAGEVVYE